MGKSIKDMTPDERGCNLPAGFMEQAMTWNKGHRGENLLGYKPHFGKDGQMTIKHYSEFEEKFQPL